MRLCGEAALRIHVDRDRAKVGELLGLKSSITSEVDLVELLEVLVHIGEVLLVRSVLVPETYNLLINPRHVQATRVAQHAAFPYPLDPRFYGP